MIDLQNHASDTWCEVKVFPHKSYRGVKSTKNGILKKGCWLIQMINLENDKPTVSSQDCSLTRVSKNDQDYDDQVRNHLVYYTNF